MALANVSAELLLLRHTPLTLMEVPQRHRWQRNLHHDDDGCIDVDVEFLQDPALFFLPQQSPPFFDDSYRDDFSGVIFAEDSEDTDPEPYHRSLYVGMFVPVISPDFSFPDPVSVVHSSTDICEDDLEETVRLPLDLFDRGPGQSRGREVTASSPQAQLARVSNLATAEEGPDFLELGLGLNFGGTDLDDAFDPVVGGEDEDGFVEEDPLGEVPEWGPDGGFNGWRRFSSRCRGSAGGEGSGGRGRRSNNNINGSSSSNNNNNINDMDYEEDGLRIVGSESGSESEEERRMITEITGKINSACEDCDDVDHILSPGDLGIPLCWDCLQIEEDRPASNNNLVEEFEWEEVEARTEAQDTSGVGIDPDDAQSNLVQEIGEVITAADSDSELGLGDHVEREDDDTVFRNIEWEVLLVVNEIEQQRTLAMVPIDGADSLLGEEHDDFVYTSEYEVLFGQFMDQQDLDLTRGRPAAKSVVSNLPSITLTQEDMANGNAVCAVCKDDISLEESAKQLPCMHHYHGDCILPWLVIRNTCPVCRHELPTDDADYEDRRSRRLNSGRSVPQVSRNTFDVLPEE